MIYQLNKQSGMLEEHEKELLSHVPKENVWQALRIITTLSMWFTGIIVNNY